MHVISRKTLQNFYEKHSDSKTALESWFLEAKNAKWSKPEEIRKKYGSADFLSGSRIVFDIKGNKYRLVVKIAYQAEIVYIRFVGTHKEYGKIDAEKI